MKKQSIDNQINIKNEINIDINDITSFLYQSKFLTKNIINSEKLELLKVNKGYNITDIFEFNRSITIKEATSKYNDLFKSLNSLLKEEKQYNLESIYYQYLQFTKNNLPLNNFLNILIMLNLILINFSEILNIKDSNDCSKMFQFNKKISIISIDNINANNDNESIVYKLNKLYERFEKNEEYKGGPVSNNLIVLIYILSLDGKILIDREIPILSNLLEKFNLYNTIYISNIHISLILYIQIVLLINIYIDSNKNKKNYLIYNKKQFQDLSRNEAVKHSNNLTHTRNNNISNFTNKTTLLSTQRKLNYNLNAKKSSLEVQKYYLNDNIQNYYAFNEEINNRPMDNDTKIILFQNYLKLFAFYSFSKNKIHSEINLSFESINEYKKIYFKNYKINNPNESIFENNNYDAINELYLNSFEILTKNNISSIFSSFNINQLIIKFMDVKNKSHIETHSFNLIDLISKSNICYFEEPVDDLINNKKDNEKNYYNEIDTLTIKELYTQFDILYFYLIFFNNNHEIKKKPKSIIIKFIAFKCLIHRENKKIQLFFNFSLVKEKTLFHYIKHSSNILILEEKYKAVISILKDFKQYESSIRLYQNNFRSQQVSFIFTLITGRIVDFVMENKLNPRISILEMNFNNFNPNLKVYIKDENMKFKNKVLSLKQMLFHPKFGNKFVILLNYLEDLLSLWNLIVFTDNENDFKLLRTFDDNKIFFLLTKDKSNINENQNFAQSPNSISNLNNNQNSKKNLGVEYINVILYFKNDENIFTKGLSFIEDLAGDKESVLEYKFTLICDRFFLETNILMEPKMKKNVKIMYNLVDDLFMIAKNIKNDNDIIENDDNDQENEYYNYDIFIADSFIAIANYHIYDIKEDEKYSTIIFEFLSILSSCIEFILYILKNKDIYIPKFIYLLRTVKDDYYMFEYKESNMFFKKVKEFNSLISLNIKETYPLFCFLSKKPKTKYTISNDNFYDIFLRLFLNLNKVVESKEKLNEIFLQKVHKNIFDEYYDSFILIAYSFEAVNFLNDFMMKNEYLIITKGDKFDKCFIILNEDHTKMKKNYQILLTNMTKEDTIIVKKLIIFNFNFKPSYFFLNKKYSFNSFHKSEFLINEGLNQLKSTAIPDFKINLKILSKIFENKSLSKNNISQIIERIEGFMIGNEKIILFNSNSKVYESIFEDYIKEKNKMKAQKVEMRVFQLTEEAKNTQNQLENNKKNCIIF